MGSSNFTVQLYCFNSIKMYYLILSIVIGSVVGEPVSVCRPTDERYFIADSVQCDRFHMCDEQGNLAAEFCARMVWYMNLSASNVVFLSRLIVSTLAELCYRSHRHKVIVRDWMESGLFQILVIS